MDKWIITKPITTALIVILIFTLSLDAQASGSTYYVAKNGSDNNPGTITQPFRTIQKAVNMTGAGDTVYIRAGTYSETVVVSTSGSANDPIKISAYLGENVIVDGTRLSGFKTYTPLVLIRADYIVVTGLEIRHSQGHGVAVNDANYVQLGSLNVHHSWTTGINIKESSNIRVQDSMIWQNVRRYKEAGESGGSGFAFIDSVDSTAQGNRIYNNYGEGLVAGRRTERIILEDNVIWDNKHASLYLLNTSHSAAERNLVYCTDDREFWKKGFNGVLRAGNGLVLQDETFKIDPNVPVSEGRVIINNIVVGCGLNFVVWSQHPNGGLKNALIANNTFVEARGEGTDNIQGMTIGGEVHVDSRLENNIVLQTVGSIIGGVPDPELQFSHNLFSRPVSKKWSSPDDVIDNPQLVNPDAAIVAGGVRAYWYRLQASSPAISAAKTIAKIVNDFSGIARDSAPDLGAHEYRVLTPRAYLPLVSK